MVLQWAKGPFTATATINYVGRFNVTDPSVGAHTCTEGLNNDNGVRWANNRTVRPTTATSPRSPT